MGSLLGNLPSYDPHNFSQLRPSDPSAQPSDVTLMGYQQNPKLISLMPVIAEFIQHEKKLTPATYHPTHNRTLPPPNQVISTEARNILLRQIYNKAEDKLRPKRAASDHLSPEHGCKQPRGSFANGPTI